MAEADRAKSDKNVLRQRLVEHLAELNEECLAYDVVHDYLACIAEKDSPSRSGMIKVTRG